METTLYTGFNEKLDHLTPLMVARILKVSEARVREMLRTKALPGIKLGRLWRVSTVDLMHHLQKLSGSDLA